MGAACTSTLTFASAEVKSSDDPMKVLIFGKAGAGKTFLLYSWKCGVGNMDPLSPTSHFNAEVIKAKSGHTLLLYDLAGNIGQRRRPFLEGTEGIIYVSKLDVTEGMLAGEEKDVHDLLQERYLQSLPVLFVFRMEDSESPPEKLLQDVQRFPLEVHGDLEMRSWSTACVRPHSQEDLDWALSSLVKLLTDRTKMDR